MMKKLLTLLILLFVSSAVLNAQDSATELKKRYKKYYTTSKKKAKLNAELKVDANDEFAWQEAKGPEDFGNKRLTRRDTLSPEALFEEELAEYDLRQQIKGVLHQPKKRTRKKVNVTKTEKSWERKLKKNL